MYLDITAGTCTVAKSSLSFFLIKTATFKLIFRISGNGLDESTANGVNTGNIFCSKYLSINSVCLSDNLDKSNDTIILFLRSAGIMLRLNTLP